MKLILRSKTVRDKTNISLDTPKCSGPPAAVRIATEVQFIAVSAVVNTAVQTIAYFRLKDQLKGFLTVR